MNTLLRLLALAGLLSSSLTFAHDGKDHPAKAADAPGKLVAPTGSDAAWLAQAREAYPLKTCVVSDEELGGDMGEAIDRIYRVANQPDRLIRFCCKSCIRDFEKDPTGCLRKLDQPAGSKSGHTQHRH